MNILLKTRFDISHHVTPTGAAGPVDFNATGDKWIITPAAPIWMQKFGIVCIALMDPDAGGFVLALDRRVTVGSDTGRVEVATLTRADAQTIAAGTGVYREIVLPVAESTVDAGDAPDHKVNVEPTGPAVFTAGQEAVFEVTNAVGAVSTGYIWAEYLQHPAAGPDFASMVKVAS
jgi:hypothetical protein